jgi:hypothetical protein
MSLRRTVSNEINVLPPISTAAINFLLDGYTTFCVCGGGRGRMFNLIWSVSSLGEYKKIIGRGSRQNPIMNVVSLLP